MKKIYLFILLLALSIPSISLSQGVNAIYSFSSYLIPEKNPYVEVNLSIDATSIEYNGDNKSHIEYLLVIKKGKEIIHADKRELKADKPSESGSSILDIQRVSLGNGKYYAEIKIKDNLTKNPPLIIVDSFNINYPKDEICISDIQIIDSYSKSKEDNIRSKNGYDIIPYLFDAVDKNKNQLLYYAEVYNSEKQFGTDNYYILNIGFENPVTKKKFEKIQRIKREKTSKVSILLGGINIEELPEGVYNLIIEARDAKNLLYAYKTIPFVRYSDLKAPKEDIEIPKEAFVNSIEEKDINEYIFCLYPIANEMHKRFIQSELKSATTEEKKIFLYNFFRQINPSNPNGEWAYYMENVKFVNERYSTSIKKGYDTEMGRVYLVYGKPDKIIDEKFKSTGGIKQRTMSDNIANPDAENQSPDGISYMPYQIWRYNKTPYGEVNKSFVFYAKQNNLMEYFLLHSDAKGEPFDRFWENTLSRGLLPEGVEGEAGIQFRKGY